MVGQKSAEQWIQDQIDTIGTMPKIQALHLPVIRDRIVEARAKLDNYCKTLDTLEFPVQFDAERKKIFGFVERYESGWEQFTRVKQSVLQAAHKQKTSGAKERQDWRNNRDKYKAYYKGKNLPIALAKSVADTLYSVAVPPESCGITTIEYQKPQCTLEPNSTCAELRNLRRFSKIL